MSRDELKASNGRARVGEVDNCAAPAVDAPAAATPNAILSERIDESDARPLRVMFALPGLHRVNRGAEVAFESIAARLAQLPGIEVTLIGSGDARRSAPYEFRHADCLPRERFERWPRIPALRGSSAYEELTFAPSLLRAYTPEAFDVVATCSYPFTNWALRLRRGRRRMPAQVFITQNGDWPARARNSEFRFFSCDGLVCTNPEYYERHRNRWRCALIPNGVDTGAFQPGLASAVDLDMPEERPRILMVSALIPSKRVLEGIACAARVEGASLVVAGDGPLRMAVEQAGRKLFGTRFRRITAPRERMPDLYRAADVLLHMSMDEPFGNIYVEALATGLPIVAHDRPATRWIVEEHAELVDTTQPEAVAATLAQAVEADSPERRQALRALAVRRFDWSVVAQAYAAFFRDVLRETARARSGAQR